MIRTQIQLTENQAARLRAMAAQLGISVAEMVRRLVEQGSRSASVQNSDERRARALEVVGRFASGRSDVSSDHDRHLAEAFGE